MKMTASNRVRVLGTLVVVSAACLGPVAVARRQSGLQVQKIEQIVGVQGMVENGVLDLPLSRTDLGTVTGPDQNPVTFDSAFELSGDAFFQPLPDGRALLNGDISLREQDTNPFIAALLKNGLVFQAFHQHLPMHPQIWFIHFRGVGPQLNLAQAFRNVINATGIPLSPSETPSKTPLDPDKLAHILHGHASVGEEGVVTVWVYRRNRVSIQGIPVNPQANISTNIEFRPTGNGTNADVVPDFSMTAHEVDPVVNLMLNTLGWYQGCLYNQETAEYPQLYFDHMLKSGDAYQLAREIRHGLDLTDAEGSPGNGDNDSGDH